MFEPSNVSKFCSSCAKVKNLPEKFKNDKNVAFVCSISFVAIDQVLYILGTTKKSVINIIIPRWAALNIIRKCENNKIKILKRHKRFCKICIKLVPILIFGEELIFLEYLLFKHLGQFFLLGPQIVLNIEKLCELDKFCEISLIDVCWENFFCHTSEQKHTKTHKFCNFPENLI